jgi:HipA-like protein
MIQQFKKWFTKDEADIEPRIVIPYKDAIRFSLHLHKLKVGTLLAKDGEWYFTYNPDFKNHLSEYKTIVGFSDVDKRYHSDELWPFFKIRIPGLRQPAIKEILSKENIDPNDEIALLKRFGERTIANPYQLVAD